MIKPFKKMAHSKREIAQTMVEFAIVFPIVLLITYGIIEFGRMVFIYTAITGAAREGARYGAAAGVGVNDILQYADCKGIRDAVKRTAFLVTIPDADIVITYDEGPGTSSKTDCPPPLDFDNPDHIKLGDRIEVRIENVEFEPVVGRFLGVGNFTFPDFVNTRTILVKIPIEP
jgi:hypothetical protein